MADEFKTIVELRQDGTFQQLGESIQQLVTGVTQIGLPIKEISTDLVLTQVLVGVLAGIVVGITFLPFGATPTSIQACQLNTNQKLLKTGGVLIVVMTSISLIFFLEVLKLNEMIGSI